MRDCNDVDEVVGLGEDDGVGISLDEDTADVRGGDARDGSSVKRSGM